MVTPGTFSVDEKGAATYEIPLKVPSGTAGMQPALFLRYSNHGGNGYLGGGWSLSGLSLITRCPKTLAQDGTQGAIRYDAGDRFCLDGQRLVLVPGAVNTYGGDGAEYRTEIETFSKIVSRGVANGVAKAGPAWFEVRTKDGRILEFGRTDDSRIEAEGRTAVMAWAVNKISDTKGNYLTVEYAEDNANGEWYPLRIDYTGNSVAGVAPFNRVTFAYDDARSDSVVAYRGGAKQQVRKRLYEIWIQQKTAPADDFTFASLIKRYQLTYQTSPASSISRLTRVGECAPDSRPFQSSNVCLAPTTFAYYGDGAPVAGATGLSLPYYNRYRSFAFGDFNGDGKIDVMIDRMDRSWQAYLSNGDGTFAAAGVVVNSQREVCTGLDEVRSCTWIGFSVPVIGDFNGDGYADVLVNGDVVAGSDEGLKIYWGSAGAAFANSTVTGLPFTEPAPMVGDFNGDGRADLIRDSSLAHFSNGAGQFPVTVALSGAAVGDQVPGDFNGDGRTDLLVRVSSGWYVWLSNPDNTFSMASQLSQYKDWHSPTIGDYVSVRECPS
jgi:hypothetical protein